MAEGATSLHNDGLFTVHIEAIRALPVDGAANGLRITAIELAAHRDLGVGMVDGAGYETVPRDARLSPQGYEIPPEHSMGERASLAEVLVRAEVEREGVWHYRGYEVTYRSGFVRHRLVVGPDLWACTPSGAPCSQLDR